MRSRFHNCTYCGQVFDREAEGSGREFLRHDCQPFDGGAKQWKGLTPRRRTGPFLRTRDRNGDFRR